MNRTAVVLSAATLAVAAFGVSGCGLDGVHSPASTSRAASAPGGKTSPLPAPDDLAAVLYRLADPSIPAEQKLALVQYATPADQPVLANFGKALHDGGFRDLNVAATDLTWSSRPQGVAALVTLSSGDDPAKSFTYPMEFGLAADGWQLTRQTAEQLFQLGAPPSTPVAPR